MTVILSADMTPEQFQAWYARLKAIDPGLNHSKLARRLDVDQPRIGKWLRNEVKISGYLELALERLEQIMLAEKRAAEQQPKTKRRAASSRGPAADGGVEGA